MHISLFMLAFAIIGGVTAGLAISDFDNPILKNKFVTTGIILIVLMSTILFASKMTPVRTFTTEQYLISVEDNTAMVLDIKNNRIINVNEGDILRVVRVYNWFLYVDQFELIKKNQG